MTSGGEKTQQSVTRPRRCVVADPLIAIPAEAVRQLAKNVTAAVRRGADVTELTVYARPGRLWLQEWPNKLIGEVRWGTGESPEASEAESNG